MSVKNCCFGLIIPQKNHNLNQKPFKSITSSSHLSSKKVFSVICQDGENQTQTVASNCLNNKAISNVGGPGNLTPKRGSDVTMIGLFGIRKQRRIFDTGYGLDKKHGSYERYLARKVGWNLKRQYNTN
tara:strand:+ start:41 stop:424 length:384 start_codon:yes stop_codon:yes gene_type:complete